MRTAAHRYQWAFNAGRARPAMPEVEPSKVPVRSNAIFGVLALLCLHASPAKADIWGYIDSDRMPHFASSRLDERYGLLLKDSDEVEPFRPMAGVAPAQTEAPKA